MESPRTIATTTRALAENRAAFVRLATEIGDLRREVATLREDLASVSSPGGLGEDAEVHGLPFPVPAHEAFALTRLVLVLLLVWLAIPALVAVAYGFRQLRAR